MTELEEAVAAYIESGDPADEDAFNALAHRVFTFQYDHIDTVRRLADRAGRPPERVKRWQDIPAVPSNAFKQLDLFCGERVAITFESSGTSGRARSRAHYSESGLDLMRVAISKNARTHLFRDGAPSRILVLAPSPRLAPQMIMAWGMEQLIETFGADGSGFLVGAEGLNNAHLHETLRRSEADGVPITLIGATFGFVHLLDGLAESGTRFYCPAGSQTMDAGGYKGRSRVLTRAEFDRLINDRLEVPAARNLNLLGMTELASQFYDRVEDGGASRLKSNAHWTRTRVLEPATLKGAPLGARGLLQHLDLANVERPMVLLTDDIGLVSEGGWQILGRAAGADAKGCSLTVEELLAPKVVPLRKPRTSD